MRNFVNPPRVIAVNGEETYLLAWWMSDNGVVIEISGPESLLLHEVRATEYDGSELKLENL